VREVQTLSELKGFPGSIPTTIFLSNASSHQFEPSSSLGLRYAPLADGLSRLRESQTFNDELVLKWAMLPNSENSLVNLYD